MATRWDWTDHLRVIERAATDLADRARATGLDAPVPTCPRWTVADLVAHQGIVHRWAVSNLTGTGNVSTPKGQVLREVPGDQLVDWFEDGAQRLLATLTGAPEDVEAMVFLEDAPPPRAFWARRQAHETTIHSVDALAAQLGRVPRADETGVDTEVALDGLDELLTGFVTRGRSKLARQDDSTLAVVPLDSGRAWVLTLGASLRTEEVLAEGDGPQAMHRFGGTAPQLYLGLWNRGEEVAPSDAELLADWHGRQRVRWS